MGENKSQENKKMQILSDKLFSLYSLTMQHEGNELAHSQFKDITVKDLHLIHSIAMNKNQTITKIAHQMSLSKATLTTSIDKLERLGYVERERNTTDRRIINIVLTKKGKLLYRLHNREHAEYINVLLKGLSDKEREDVNKALDNLIGYLDKIENNK